MARVAFQPEGYCFFKGSGTDVPYLVQRSGLSPIQQPPTPASVCPSLEWAVDNLLAGVWVQFSSVQSLSHVRLFCDPMNCSTPGLPVHHQLPESTQTHVHYVGDAIQPSHPLLAPSPPALNLSQHQGLLK